MKVVLQILLYAGTFKQTEIYSSNFYLTHIATNNAGPLASHHLPIVLLHNYVSQ